MKSWMSTVQVESEQRTVHSLHQTQLEKKGDSTSLHNALHGEILFS
jgi:hypothetical protein